MAEPSAPMSKRKMWGIVAVLVLIAGTAAFFSTRLTPAEPEAIGTVLSATIPGAGDSVLRQAEIGIDLEFGWDASLVADQVPIPDEQLIKTLELGQIRFQPGPGKAIEAWVPGQNCVTATYWPQANENQRFTKTWCFVAT